MKKRNLKSFELNKKTISTFETSKLDGGVSVITFTCTLGVFCIAAGDFIDGFIDGWNESNQ
jgi:hypothetical protein